jgi:hypothetical protein
MEITRKKFLKLGLMGGARLESTARSMGLRVSD